MKQSFSWVEKNRPNKLDDLCYQDKVKLGLKNLVKQSNIPHLLFFGPSGTGKTSTIIAMAKELFGDQWRNRIKELNASDERGINVVRDKIKNFAHESINTAQNIPPWKIIILDEADNMTSESQYALRRIMEECSRITRFCIICNYHHKIIDPIVSRCSVFRFRPLPKKVITNKLIFISKNEKLECSNKVIKKISDYARGDLRKAINFLQRCHNCFGDKVNSLIIDDISGIISKEHILSFILECIKKNEDNVKNFIDYFTKSGYSLVNQILLIHNTILEMNIPESAKTNIILILGSIDHSLIKGCDEYIQLKKLAYYIMSVNL
jgi:replication factor C subunit 2/4